VLPPLIRFRLLSSGPFSVNTSCDHLAYRACFLVVLGFELRASQLLDRHTTS
jgi:hypothetical protein